MVYHPTPNSPIYDHLINLRRELEDAGLHRNDRAIVMIEACIEKGFDTKYMILKGIGIAGMKGKYVETMLDGRTGEIPGLHLWRLDKHWRYHLLSPA